MARPKKWDYPRVTTTLSFDAELIKKIEDSGESKTEVMQKALTKYFAPRPEGGRVIEDDLEDKYCEAHDIAIAGAQVINLKTGSVVLGEVAALHQKTIEWIRGL